jgi:serine/threonine-protein kinase RsbW
MQVEATLHMPRDASFVGGIRDSLGSLLLAIDAPSDAIDDLKLAMDEACGNVIKHAEGTREYRIVIDATPGSCEVAVIDAGPGLPEGARPPAPGLAEHGRGLDIIDAVSDEYRVESDEANDTTTVTIVRRWDG